MLHELGRFFLLSIHHEITKTLQVALFLSTGAENHRSSVYVWYIGISCLVILLIFLHVSMSMSFFIKTALSFTPLLLGGIGMLRLSRWRSCHVFCPFLPKQIRQRRRSLQTYTGSLSLFLKDKKAITLKKMIG